MTTILDPPNEAPVDELFAFLSIDGDGNEGICAAILPNLGSTPLVTSKARVADMMKDKAREIARLSGKSVQLVRFRRADMQWRSE